MQDSTRVFIKGNPTSKFKSLNEKISQLTKENNILKNDIQDSKNIIEHYNKVIKNMKHRINELETELETLKAADTLKLLM